MFLWIGRVSLLGVLFAQAPEPFTVEEELYRLQHQGPANHVVTMIATHVDGSPLRGYIQCGGYWTKHVDEDTTIGAPNLPFKTDSRGAVIFNPGIEDTWIFCFAEDGEYAGETLLTLSKTRPNIGRILLKEKQ